MLGRDEPLLRVIWTDPDTGKKGYCVIDRLVGDIATGGTRMRAGLTLAEVEDLARGMTAKAGVFRLPVGGAKGGIDCDPREPAARGVLTRFVRALRPLLAQHWVTAEDLGVSQATLDEVFDEAGLGMSLHAALVRSKNQAATLQRVREAFAVQVEDIPLPDVIGGFGVAEAAVEALRALGRDPRGCRAVVQGFGSMGGSSARYLARHGVRVVGVADREGLVTNPDGLDVDRLLQHRTDQGDIDRRCLGPRDEEHPGDTWLGLDVDLLVPAAVSYAITAENSTGVQAPLIVEAANVPTTPEAERLLLARGVQVIPDFVANGGAAAWAWWTLFGDISPEPADAFAKLSAEMRDIVGEVFEIARPGELSPRQAAMAIAQRNLDGFEAALAAGKPPRAIR